MIPQDIRYPSAYIFVYISSSSFLKIKPYANSSPHQSTSQREPKTSFADLVAPRALVPHLPTPNFPQILFPKMPLIQLQPHPFTDLPAHPSLPSGPARPEARQVANTALQEALQLLNSDLPTWEKDSKLRRSPPAYAEIRLSRKWRKNEKDTNSSAKQKPEFWVCRQSEHHDANVVGSAPWSEFEDGLRSEHAEHEMEYTPSVTGVERLLQWTEQEIGELDISGVTFGDVDLEGELTE